MHAYATDATDRVTIPLWLAAAAVAATLLFNSVLRYLNLQIPWWVDAPSVMGFYGIFYKWFDSYAWSLTIGTVPLSSIPNLKGTWVGVIHSSYNGGTRIPGVLLYVRQTWSSIIIRMETETSSSFSIMAAVNTQDSSEPSLKYEYMNEPSALSLRTMESHRGTANLRLSPDGLTLKGDYFTGRGRQNVGTLEFVLISRHYLTRKEGLKRFGAQ